MGSPSARLFEIGSILLVLASVYGAIVLAVYFYQPRLIYFPNLPSRSIIATPQDIGLSYERVSLETEDGLRLQGWFIPAPEARGVLLFLHGNAGNISHRLDSIRIFHKLRLSVLIFDYRGYGESEGEPSELGTYLDAEAAWRHLTQDRGVSADKIVLFGRSLGASIAAYLASRLEPAALIVESTFTSVPDLAQELYPFLPARWLSRFRYDTREYLRATSRPVLIVHSPNDEIIPYAHGEALYAAAASPKHLLKIHGGHNDGFLASGAAYVCGLDRFLKSYLGE
ncbi:MAG TPA: alpha/beta hydrolase [Burkholderiales bacterium]|nr:alpha/beta hydrolase [Burkholderiales bacterium]